MPLALITKKATGHTDEWKYRSARATGLLEFCQENYSRFLNSGFNNYRKCWRFRWEKPQNAELKHFKALFVRTSLIYDRGHKASVWCCYAFETWICPQRACLPIISYRTRCLLLQCLQCKSSLSEFKLQSWQQKLWVKFRIQQKSAAQLSRKCNLCVHWQSRSR